MELTCFVIMPISDPSNYPEGHFKRVYEHIVKPACIKAGFKPLRADDILNTNYIALDIIKRIINSDMAICDTSSRNPNVMYELGIRQAFNLPITLIRDSLSDRIFDIQGFRDIQYDETLRIDNVELIIDNISKTLKNTYESRGKEINSLISLLGVQSAKVTNKVEISNETELILSSIATISNRISQIEAFIPSQQQIYSHLSLDENDGNWKEMTSLEKANILINDVIDHPKFGKGRVIGRSGNPDNPIATVWFQFNGEKNLMLNYVQSLRKFFPKETKTI